MVSRFAASTIEGNSDYVDMVDYSKSRDRNADVNATNLSMPSSLPKKVVMINDSAPSSPNPQLKMLTNVVAYEKKIKETKSSILKQKYPLHAKKAPSKLDLMPALPSTYRVESNQNNTKLMGRNRKLASRLSS